MEGSEGWLVPMGKAFCILSAFALIAGGAWFIRQEYVLHRWPMTQGIVTDSHLLTTHGDHGPMCSAAYRVAYSVKSVRYASDQVEHTSTSDCAWWQEQVAAAKGASRKVLYDPNNPNMAYFNPGFNSDFLIVPFWCVCFAAVFTFFGAASWFAGNYMARHNLQLP